MKALSLFIAMVCLSCSPLCGEVEKTLSIIKPHAVQENHIGAIIARLEKAGLAVKGMKMTNLSEEQAREFYAVHKERPFFLGLVSMMSAGPIVVMVLEGDGAIATNRKVMGATEPEKAAMGTIRADFGKDIQNNAVHGSDSEEAAKEEIAFFFDPSEVYN